MPEETVVERPRLSSLFGNMELLIAVLLGVVSITTAYTSFQAALYSSQMAANYTIGQNLATEAESLYLEANQQFIQDAQLWNRLTELSIEMDSSDPSIAEDAIYKYDTLVFVAVSEEFGAAIEWAAAENETNPDVYTSPFDSEEYREFLYSGWAITQEDAKQAVSAGNTANSFGDRLTLNTVLFSVSLFLLGISAVFRQRGTQLVLITISLVIFLVGAGLTAAVPFVGV